MALVCGLLELNGTKAPAGLIQLSSIVQAEEDREVAALCTENEQLERDIVELKKELSSLNDTQGRRGKTDRGSRG